MPPKGSNNTLPETIFQVADTVIMPTSVTLTLECARASRWSWGILRFCVSTFCRTVMFGNNVDKRKSETKRWH